jgi:hypothetical protein
VRIETSPSELPNQPLPARDGREGLVTDAVDVLSTASGSGWVSKRNKRQVEIRFLPPPRSTPSRSTSSKWQSVPLLAPRSHSAHDCRRSKPASLTAGGPAKNHGTVLGSVAAAQAPIPPPNPATALPARLSDRLAPPSRRLAVPVILDWQLRGTRTRVSEFPLPPSFHPKCLSWTESQNSLIRYSRIPHNLERTQVPQVGRNDTVGIPGQRRCCKKANASQRTKAPIRVDGQGQELSGSVVDVYRRLQ